MKLTKCLATIVAVALIAGTPLALQGQDSSSPPEDKLVELDTIVVTPFSDPRSADDFAQPIFLTRGDRLSRRIEPTLGQTLEGAAGVSSTYFGPGASRPIIRGIGGDRIRILNQGLGTFDASVVSPDHAVSLEPLFAKRIEVIRGPATLMYGSSAIGGVVNTIDRSLPDQSPEKPVSGEIEVRYGSNNSERVGAGHFDGGTDSFGWHISGLRRETDDIRIPAPPEVQHDHEEEGDDEHGAEPFDGTLPNSAVETETFNLGVSTFWDKGHAGVAYTHYDTFYGIPGGHEHGHEEEPDDEGETHEDHDHEGIRVDLTQQKLLARAGITQPVSWLEEVNLRLGLGDYEHLELEGAKIGTRFATEAFEGRLDAVHREIGRFVGAFGLQFAQTDFEAAGEEAFIPPTDTRKWSFFAIENYIKDRLSAQLGARYENQNVAVTDGSNHSVAKAGVSVSGGAVWRFSEDYSLGFSVARSERLPNAQELFADGPHAATRAYEIGDSGLETEVAWSADLVLRKRIGFITGQVSLFANRFDRYIFEERTGEVENGLPVYRFVARDAEFVGGELEAVLHTHQVGNHTIDLKVLVDSVRATDTTSNEPLPRIPPFRYGMGIDIVSGGVVFGAEIRHSATQERTAPLETPTDSYNSVSAYVSYGFNWGETEWTVYLRGTNLTDEEARTHTSFLKDEVPLPGRNIVTGIRMGF